MSYLTSIKEHWTKYVSESTIHAIPDIKNASTVKKRIFWSVLLVAALAATVWEIMMVFDDYRTSPIITTYQMISQKTQEFPKIEICLDNMVNRERVLALKLAPVLVNYALLTLPTNIWFERSTLATWAAASGIIRAEPMLFPIAIQKNRTYALNKSHMLSDRFNITYEERVIGFAQVEAEISDALSIKNTQAHFVLDTWKQIEGIIRILQENKIEINKPATTVRVLEISPKKPTTVKINMGTTTAINRGYFEYLDEKNITSVSQKLKKSEKIYQKPQKFKVTMVDGTDEVTATQETDHPTMQTTGHPTTTMSDEQVIELILAAAENQYSKDQLMQFLGYTAEETPPQDEIFEKVQQQPYLLVMLGLSPDDSKEQMIERLHAKAQSPEKKQVTRIQESIINTQKLKVGSDTTKPTDSQIGTTDGLSESDQPTNNQTSSTETSNHPTSTTTQSTAKVARDATKPTDSPIGTTISTDATSDQPITNTASSTEKTNHPRSTTTQATDHSMTQTTGHPTTTMSDEQVIELILAAAENQYSKDQLMQFLGYPAEETPPQDEIFEKLHQQPYLLVMLGLSPDDSKEQMIERLHVKARSPEKKQVTRIQESFTNTQKPKVGSDATKPTDSQIGTTISTDGTSDQPTTNTTSSNETTNHPTSTTTQETPKVGSDTTKPTDSQSGTTISTDGTSDQPTTNITPSTETTNHPTSTTTQATAKVGSDATKPTDSQIGTTISTDGTSDQPTTDTSSETTNHPTSTTTQATDHSMTQTTGHPTTTMSDEQVIELILAATENQYSKDQLMQFLGYPVEETPPQDEIFEKLQQQPYLLVMLGLSPDDSKEQMIERLHAKAQSPEKNQVTRIQESITNTQKPKVGSDTTKPTDSQIGTTISTDGTSDQPTTNTTSSTETTNHPTSTTTQAMAKVVNDTTKPTDSQIGTTISTDRKSDQPTTNTTSSTETTNHPTSTTTQEKPKVGSDTTKPTDSQIGTTISTDGTSDQPTTNTTSSTKRTNHPTSTTTQEKPKVGSDATKPTNSQSGTTISTDGTSDQPTTNTTSSTETTNHPTSTTTQAIAKVVNDTTKPTDSQIGTTISTDRKSDQPTTNTTSSTETTNHPTSTTTQAMAKVVNDTTKPTDSQFGTTISTDGTSDQPTTNTTSSTKTTNPPTSTTTQDTPKVGSDTTKPTDSQIGTTISTDGTSDQPKTNITSSTKTTNHPTSTTTQETPKVVNDTTKPTDSQSGTTISTDGTSDQPTTNTTTSTETTNHPTSTTTQAMAKVVNDTTKPTDSQIGTTISTDRTSDQPTTNTTSSTETTNHPTSTTTQATAKVVNDTTKPTDSQIGTTISTDATSDQPITNTASSTETTNHPTSTATQATAKVGSDTTKPTDSRIGTTISADGTSDQPTTNTSSKTTNHPTSTTTQETPKVGSDTTKPTDSQSGTTISTDGTSDQPTTNTTTSTETTNHPTSTMTQATAKVGSDTTKPTGSQIGTTISADGTLDQSTTNTTSSTETTNHPTSTTTQATAKVGSDTTKPTDSQIGTTISTDGTSDQTTTNTTSSTKTTNHPTSTATQATAKVGSDTTKPTDLQIGTTISADGTSDQATTNTSSKTTNHPTSTTTQATNHSMTQTTGHPTTTMSDEQVIELILAATENQYSKDQLMQFLGYPAEETPPQDEIFEKLQQQPYLLVMLGLSPDDSKEQIIEQLHAKAQSAEKKRVKRNLYRISTIIEKAGINVWANVYLADLAKELYFGSPPEAALRKIVKKMLTNYENHTPHIDVFTRHYDNIEKYIIDQETGDLDVEKLFHSVGHTASELLKSCYFQTTKLECAQFTKMVFDQEFGQCFLIEMGEGYDQLGAGLGLMMQVNTMSSTSWQDIPSLTDGISVRISKEFNPISRQSFQIPAGTAAKINFQATHYMLNQSEKYGRCQRDMPRKFTTAPYSDSVCRLECGLMKLVEKCGCLFGVSKRFIKSGLRYPFCAEVAKIDCLTHIDLLEHKDEKISKCLEACRPPCDYYDYSPMVSYKNFPSPQLYEWYKIIDKQWSAAHREHYFHSRILLDIAYSSMEHMQVEEKGAMSVHGFISQIGGHLGLFLGASALSFAQILFYCIFCSCDRKQKVSNEDGEPKKNIVYQTGHDPDIVPKPASIV